MAQRTLPNLALEGFFDLGEDGWDDEMSLNLLKLSVLVQGTALGKVSADPVGPADGDVYILDETHPTQANKIAIRDDGDWVYVTPREGWLVFNQAADYYEKFDGAAWAELATGGGGGGGIPDAPEDDKLYGRMNAAWEEVPGGGLAGDPVPFVGARGTRTTNTTINGVAALAFTAEDYDYGGWHDNATNNTRFVVPAGVTKIRLNAQVDFSGSGNRSIRFLKNGAGTQIATGQVGNSAYSFTLFNIDSGVVECVPGDYFELIVETGSSQTIQCTSGRTWMSVEAVAEKVVGEDLSADVNTRAGTTYTLAETDTNDIVEMSNGAANVLTIPANATVSLPVGAMFSIVQVGEGATTIQAAAGVTLNGVSEGEATLSGQWSGVSLYKRATDAWVIQGGHGGVS